MLTMTCMFSRFVLAEAIPNIQAETIADVITERLVAMFGTPEVLLTDRGSNYTSELVQNICQRFNIKKKETSAYHPQSDGLQERWHKVLGDSIRTMSHIDPIDWDRTLPVLLLCYRNTYHTTLGDTPMFCAMGYDALLPFDVLVDRPLIHKYTLGTGSARAYGAELQARMKQVRGLFQTHIQKELDRSHEFANKKRSTKQFQVGDLVLFRRYPTNKSQIRKLFRPYTGVFRVTERLGSLNVNIKEVGGRKIRSTHINRLIAFDPSFRQLLHSWAETDQAEPDPNEDSEPGETKELTESLDETEEEEGEPEILPIQIYGQKSSSPG